MAQGISVALPLIYNQQDGPYQLNKNILDTVRQNFKNLVLTNKGERIMDPDFGIGIYGLLFENYIPGNNQAIKADAIDQAKKYMPFIEVEDFIITENTTNLNQFNIYIRYSVRSLNVLDELSFVVSK